LNYFKSFKTRPYLSLLLSFIPLTLLLYIEVMDYFSLNNPCWVPNGWAKPKPFLKMPNSKLLKKKMVHGNINLRKIPQTSPLCFCRWGGPRLWVQGLKNYTM